MLRRHFVAGTVFRSYLATNCRKCKALCEYMNYYIYSGNLCLGESKLDRSDLSMGMVHGVFIPAPEYQKVKSTLLLFVNEQYDEYYEKRDELGLTLQDDSGNIIATNTIHIEDYWLETNEMNVEVALTDGQSWPANEYT
jgi:hypothetical protein